MTEQSGPLSFCQELLLYQEIFSGIPPTISRIAKICGALDLPAFERAANATIKQHEALRSTWEWRFGEPVCNILPFDPALPSVSVLDCDPEGLGIASAGPMGMAGSDPPHMQHWLVQFGDQEHLWVFGAHHMAADAVSLKLYAETFRQAYTGLPIENGGPTASIAYAGAQREWLRSRAAQDEFDWWQRRLGEIETQRLPVAAASAASTVAAERQELRICTDARTVIDAARYARVPVATLFLTAYAKTVAARQGAASTYVFTNLAGRSLRGASSATGAFYNSVPIRLSGQANLKAAIAETANSLFEALDHQEVPVALLSLGAVERGGLPLADRFPVSFNVVDHPLASFSLPGCQLMETDGSTLTRPRWGHSAPTPLGNGTSSTRATMDWLVTVMPTSIVITLEYTPQFVDPDDVRSLLLDYRTVLSALFAERPVSTSGEAGLIADWRNIA